MSMPRGCLKLVWGCVERGGKEAWAHIGYAWDAEDGAVHARLRAFTPALFPFLFAVLVWLEAPLSGTSTNPARSLGPGLVAGAMSTWWVYWLGPLVGTLAGVAIQRAPWMRSFEIRVAKVFHFHHDRYGVFHGAAAVTGPRVERG